MSLETINRRCTHRSIVEAVPYINDSFTEEMLLQVKSCTFLDQLQRMAPCMIISRIFEKGTQFDTPEYFNEVSSGVSVF